MKKDRRIDTRNQGEASRKIASPDYVEDFLPDSRSAA